MKAMEAHMRKPAFVSWLAVTNIRVMNDVTPSPATIGNTISKLGRQTEKNTSLVVRRLGEAQCPKLFELVTGRREYEASRQLGRTKIPCRIMKLTDEEAATLRRLDVLTGPGVANDLVRGWELMEAAAKHDWERADLTSLLPTGRSQIGDAWNAARALPRDRVFESCRASGIRLEAVADLKRKEIRHLRDLPEEERVEVLVAHLAAPGESSASLNGGAPEQDRPPLDELVGALAGRLRERPWTERAACVVRLAATLIRG